MSPIKLIKKGIETQNWGLICKAYEQLTGDEISIEVQDNALLAALMQLVAQYGGEPTNPTKPESAPKKETKETPIKKTEVKAKKNTDEFIVDDENIEPEYDAPPLPTESGKVKAGKPVLPFDNADDERWAELNKKVKVDKTSRKAYKENMQKCASCPNVFDLNKEYPIQSKDLAIEGYKCNKCRSRG